MEKRGQITVFVIIVLMLMIIFGLLFLIRQEFANKVLEPEKQEADFLNAEKAALQQYVDSCLEMSLKKGYQQVGLYDVEVLEEYIEDELYQCVDLSAFEEMGLKATKKKSYF